MRLAVLSVLAVAGVALGDPLPTQVLPLGETSTDSRLGKVRTLNDKDFFFTPPTSLDEWKLRRQKLRKRILVSTGLWPMPAKTPLEPVIHGKIDREGYTVEKVFFASMPGHYVSGNLYRPKGKPGKHPGVLCPHGHWRNGRFYDAGEAAAKKQIKDGAEKTIQSGRYPLQARYAQLARMGCVVFHYDMVGYADSTNLQHRSGFGDAKAELHLQNMMGLQTWNSIRCLDFITSLPDVDSKRIAVTGGSGGGTQTFMLCAIDDRPAVSVPAVMVGTEMQGGCVCENCSYLRQEVGNVEIAGLFAPKPLALIGADDWTVRIEKRGYPELKKLYKLHGVEDKVLAKCFSQFGHNYNQVSREFMYEWLNKHLGLGLKSPIKEQPFVPIAPKELSVFTKDYPRPKDSANITRLRDFVTAHNEQRFRKLLPKDKASLTKYRNIVGTAARAMLGNAPTAKQITSKDVGTSTLDGFRLTKHLIGRTGTGEAIPTVVLHPKRSNGTYLVWIHPDGKKSILTGDTLTPAVKKVLDDGTAIVAPDVYGVGELALGKPMSVDKNFAGYTFGYNRPLVAQRVRDILTSITFAHGQAGAKRVRLVGFDKAGPWALLARSVAGDKVDRTATDWNNFRFDKIRSVEDEMMLPGGLKYGGLAGLTAVAAPSELLVYDTKEARLTPLKLAYKVADADTKLAITEADKPAEEVLAWLVK